MKINGIIKIIFNTVFMLIRGGKMNHLLDNKLEKKLIKMTKLDTFIDIMEHATMLFHENGSLLYYNEPAKKLFNFKKSFSFHDSSLFFLSQQIVDNNMDQIDSEFSINEIKYYRSVRKISFDDVIFLLETLEPLYVYQSRLEKSTTQINEMDMIIDSVHDGIYITDEKGFTLRINNKYSQMTGIHKEEVIGRHVSELVYRGYFDNSITLKVLENKKTVSMLQKIRDGDQLWLVTGNPIFNKDGDLVKMFNTVYDMTELNRLRESLKAQEIMNNNQKVELQVLRSQIAEVPGLIGNSHTIRTVKTKINKIAGVDSTVLLLGETGCGKNVVAKAIHQLSSRSSKPFIEINCGALPEQLIESELFGYANGAFTGAVRGGKAGLLEIAHEGTIFLDEIGELPLHLQVKLLTFLQDKKVRRVGGNNSKEVDVRVIAATHQNLKQLIVEKKFREDLYYRLSVVPIKLPALRNYKEDIYVLTNYFLKKYNGQYKSSVHLSKGVYLALENYEWPGNVRELQYLIEQLVVLCDDNTIDVQDLPDYVHDSKNSTISKSIKKLKKLDDIVKDIEFQVIKATWEELGDVSLVADRLGMHRTTLVRKAKKIGLNLTK